jgi:hypothetical protein
MTIVNTNCWPATTAIRLGASNMNPPRDRLAETQRST